ncbi:MAG: gliding motility-associated C-terminal domain-containing protein [Bacteroidales bacterium]|nr:gliding motility-associated C-terminal domain-containing protein [Bacteroidales bacterium]
MQAHNTRDTIGIGARILFSENKGQWDSRVLFRSQMHSSTLFVERDCFTLVVQHPDNDNLKHFPCDYTQKGRYRQHAYRIRFEGSNTSQVEGLDREECRENYFIGRDHSRWATDVRVFQSVLYHNLYDDIDLKVYTASNAMKYDFIVNPGARPSDIVIGYEGVEGLRIQNGNLIVRTSVADIVELRPYAYQLDNKQKIEVKAEYQLKNNKITFKLGNYDTTLPLIIDPYLHFSTYTGSTADNWGTTACYDSEKNTYTAGVVFGSGYPTSLGAYDGTYNGNCDIGIFKFDPSGSTRLFATYLGGTYADMPHSMYVNSYNELLIFGTTGSSDFPVTEGAYDTSFNGGTAFQYEGSTTINFPNGSDIFICRFSTNGDELQASTFVGGSGNDGLNYRNSFDYNVIMMGNDSLYYNYGDGARGELITDDQNNIYVGSTTFSTNFPVTEGCIQPNNHGRQEGIVLKIDHNLRRLIWSTYLGGNKDDAIYSIDCDKDYNVVVCGGTNSYNFPTTPSAYRTYYSGGSADGFIAKISYYGNQLMASTQFGSSAYDQCYFVRCSKNNDVFIFGQTKAVGSTLIHNANYNTPNSGQLLARFKPGLDTLVWSTVFGTGDVTTNGPNISPTAFAVDICNRIYLSGWGRIFLGRTFDGVNYPWNQRGTTGLTVTADAYQSSTDGQDFYIMAVDINANQLVYATFFGEQHTSGTGYYSGGDHVDGGTSRFDRHGTLYQSVCASCSGGDEFPVTTGAYGQHNNSSNCNNAIFRLNLTDDFPVADFSQPVPLCAPTNSEGLANLGRGDHFKWIFGDGTEYETTTTQSVTHSYPTPGLYQITLVAYMDNGCKASDTMTQNLMVFGRGSYSLDTLSTCPGIPLQIGLPPTPYTNYHWIGGNVSDSTIANPIVNQSGVYTLIVSSEYADGPNCRDTVTQVVLVGEADATIVGDTLSCSIPTVLDVSAPGNHVTYQWSSNGLFSDTLNNDMSQSLFSFTPDSDQWIYVHVEDDLRCVKEDSIHIRFYKVVDSLIVTDPLCPNYCTGAVRVVPSTANSAPPRQYNWGNGWNNVNMQEGFCAGDGTVLFRDGNGCLVTNEFTITSPPMPTISDSVTHIRCLESCTGAISVDVNGPSVYSLLWLDDSSTTATRTDLCAGNYILQVSDSNGCLFYDTITILENVDMSVEISDIQNSCSNACSGIATALATGGYAPYTYVWSSGEQTATATELCAGTVFVVATDQFGCEVRDSIVINEQHSFDSIHVWADADYVFAGQSAMLHVTPIPGGSYYWMPSNLLDNPTSPNTRATVEDTTVFVVTVTDSIGCTYSDSVKLNCVTVNCGEPNIFIPNAFTPNDDGKNDRLCFSGEWVQEFHIAIFTRWGEKIYESDNINDCWDGRYKNNWCMPGVYVYHCRIKCEDGQVSQFKGDVTLIR